MRMRGKIAACFVASLLVAPAFAGKPQDKTASDKKQPDDQLVFVTGSLIPQRIKLKRIGTTTTSPVRIIDRQEIEATGRRTTRGALVADPSVRGTGY